MSRAGMVLRGLWESAIRWPKIWLGLHTGDKADKNALADHHFGFSDPALKVTPKGGKAHRAIDLIVEWIRLNAQRAAKLGAFTIMLLVTLLLAALVAIVVLLIL